VTLKSKSNKTMQASLVPLQSGQVWALKDSNIHISDVGRTLVFYKRMSKSVKRAPVSLATKAVLEKFLLENHGELVK